MKTFFLLLAIVVATSVAAQTKDIYGKFTKSDGTKINGTVVVKGFEKLLIINNYTGGSDNTAIIEIEVPTAAYVSDFRNLMNSPATVPSKITPAPKVVTRPAVTAPAAKTEIKKPNLATTQAQATLSSAEINVLEHINGGTHSRTITKIILQDVSILSVTDSAATGKSIIKLKGNRIGWIYYSYDTGGKISVANKSGWDVVAGAAWTNF